MTDLFYDPEKTLVSDTECYPNFWSIGFRRVSDGRELVMEHSHRKQIDRARLIAILKNNTIIGFNWRGYDQFMVAKAIEEGVTCAALKRLNDQIIGGGLKWWQVEETTGVTVPRRFKFIDLLESQPSVAAKPGGGGDSRPAGLKLMMGRMHAPTLQDLPYAIDTHLTDGQIDMVLRYMCNDLAGTHMLFDKLQEPLMLRAAFGKKYGIDLMSMSDSQCGEAIFKKRVKDKTGNKVTKVETPPGTVFKFKPPAFITFDPGSELDQIYRRICDTEFMVGPDKKVGLPDWLAERKIAIGESVYQMGIGGLHSTEANRALWSDDEYVYVDLDAGSYYPITILNAGLYPKAIGPEFLEIYREITEERLAAKAVAADNLRPDDLRLTAKHTADGVKIFINGGGFGKLGSPYSVLNAPHLMVTVTLTGQLALLMLIQRAENAGISVVSANTDGVVFRIPRSMMSPIVKDRITAGPVAEIAETWERDTGFLLEATEYRAILNASVNEYIAVKPDGKVKRKGKLSNPYKEGTRTQLMKNPNAGVCSDAVVELIVNGTPIEQTIRGCQEVRDFVSVVQVQGGGIWTGDGGYLGKVVRYIWTRDGGHQIIRKKGHWKTGTQGKVPKTDGCRPLMELPDTLPADIDYDRYIAEAESILMDIGYNERPVIVKPPRVYKHNALAWFTVAM